jgi:ACS family hexuronate transporter-like MFS transporter
MPGSRRIRWKIVWVLFFSTALNYINRQTLSLLAPVIASELHFNHEHLSRIFGAFQMSYAWTWLLGGVILDFVGTRVGLSLAVIWWSVTSMVNAFANSLGGFIACRALLGIGEGFNWPGASKVVAEWFPAKERSVAVAIFDSGSSVGAAVAAIAIPLISMKFGWRPAFIISGLLGFVWLIFWLKNYHPLQKHPKLSAEETALIQEGEATSAKAAETRLTFRILKYRNTWGIVLGRSLTDPMWWFFVFWLPQYLSEARGFSLKQLALFAWIPFAASDLGNITGGFASGLLIRRGMPVIQARKVACVLSCIPMMASLPAVTVSNPYVALTYICIALWGYAAWSTMGLTLPSDLFDQKVVGTVTGLSGFVAGLLGTAVTLLVGVIVDRSSYFLAFLFVTALPVLATVSVLVLVRDNCPASSKHRSISAAY